MAMNELPWNGGFVKRAIDDWIRGESDDVLTWRMLVFKLKDGNGN